MSKYIVAIKINKLVKMFQFDSKKDAIAFTKGLKKPIRFAIAHMKFLIVFLTTTVLIGCGAKQTGSPVTCDNSRVTGNWIDGSGELNLRANCQGYRQACGETFTLPPVTENSGVISINVTSTPGGASCLPSGQVSCSYGMRNYDNILDVNCGGGLVFIFNRLP